MTNQSEFGIPGILEFQHKQAYCKISAFMLIGGWLMEIYMYIYIFTYSRNPDDPTGEYIG